MVSRFVRNSKHTRPNTGPVGARISPEIASMNRLVWLVMLACASLSQIAGAADDTAARVDVVVLESYAEGRPSDAADLLAPLYDELRLLGYAADPKALATRVETQISRSGDTLSDADLAEALGLVDTGYAGWLAGEFGRAAEELSAALAMFRDRPATVAAQPGHRDAVFRALVGLSLARARLGDTEAATAAMAELVRSFPDREISRAEFGPEPRALYANVKADLGEQDRGTLRVDTDDSTVVVFVNGRYAGIGTQTLEDLHPGSYRLFAQRGSEPGRVHDIDVASGGEHSLSITWGLDASLRSAAEYVGFVFADERSRQDSEAGYASSVARRIKATGVVVVGIRRYRGRRSIVGTVIDLDSGNSVRTGAIALEPAAPAADDVRALARFLAGGRATHGVLVERVEGESPPDDSGPTTSASRWPWLVIGGGVLALAGGATLIAIDAPSVEDGDQQPEHRDTRTPGIVLAAGGAVATGVGVYLWWRDRRHGRATEIAVVPTVGESWGLALTGRF